MSLIDENRNLREQLSKYKFDHLTGLKLRYDFETETQSLLDNSISFYMTMVDVDGLHNVNRKYGIKSGDVLLQSVVSDCKKVANVREIYRIGGDEFIILTSSFFDGCIRNSKCATIGSDKYDFVCDMLRDVDKLVTVEKAKTDRRRG